MKKIQATDGRGRRQVGVQFRVIWAHTKQEDACCEGRVAGQLTDYIATEFFFIPVLKWLS